MAGGTKWIISVHLCQINKMLNLSKIVAIALLLAGCNTTRGKAESRESVIHKAVNAIMTHDSDQFLKLIDTTLYFRVHTKGQVLFQMESAYTKITGCNSEVDFKQMKIAKGTVYDTKYIIPICSSAPDSKSIGIPTIAFSFPDDGTNRFIDFELTVPYEIQPLVPAPR